MPPDEPLVLHRGVGAPTKCKSKGCEVKIVFAEHSATGKLSPFEPDDGGDWTIENGKAIFVGKNDRQLVLGAKPVQRFTSHFARCPEAKNWRKR